MFRLLAEPAPTGRLNVTQPDFQFHRPAREGKTFTFPLEMSFHNLERRLMDAYMREPMILRCTNAETTVAFDIEASSRFKQELQDYWFNDIVYGHPGVGIDASLYNTTPKAPFAAMHGNLTMSLATFKAVSKEHKEWKAKLWDYVPFMEFVNHRIDSKVKFSFTLRKDK